MICPNCGRELPDTARVCPSCNAVQRINKRRRAEADVEESAQRVPVSRRVSPEQAEKRRRQREQQGSPSTPERADAERVAPQGSKMPVGLYRQEAFQRENVRHVRHVPSNTRRKVDAAPAMYNPPIYRKTNRKLLRILFVILLMAIGIVSAAGYMLVKTEDGQQLMAQWGWKMARTDAYVTLGKELLDQAYPTRALEKLQVAVDRESNNVDAQILMAQAYTELGQIDEAKRIYEKLITEIAPSHPSAYRNLIKIYQNEGYNAEAIDLMRTAAQNATSTQEFDVMLREYTPVAPKLSFPEGRYNAEFDVRITIPEGQTVYYSTDGTDPSESGLVYADGTDIHIPEGKLTLKVIGFTENGTPSEQITANYSVIIPTPAAPKANYASGPYKSAPKVSLRSGDDPKDKTGGNTSKIVAFYYTLDGRQATTEATLYNDEEKIQIPVGRTTLRAIGVAENGKISYEMSVTYDVQGNLKKMFSSEDQFKNLELYKTGYPTFTKAWGAPISYEVLPQEEWYSADMESYEAVYEWGTARFLIKKAGGTAVLYALDTTNPKMGAPRGTKVGMSSESVLEKFRDLGHPAQDAAGNRLLYNYSSQSLPPNLMFGTYRQEADGTFAIHYYDPIDEKHTIFAELSYYMDRSGNVARIVWQRYTIAE